MKTSAPAPEEKAAPEQPPAASPEAKKAAAEKAAQPAAAAGTESKSAETSAPDKASPGKEGEAKDQDKPAYSVQLGAFQTEENATRLLDTLKSRGYPAFLFRVMDADGHVWHTVRLGHYADMKEAARAAVKVSTKEQISAWVRPANAF